MAKLSRAAVEKQVGSEWVDLLLPFMSSDKMDTILNALAEDKKAGYSVLPNQLDIFRCFRETPLSKVRVVIIGQDPYPTKSHACGLAFSLSEEQAAKKEKLPASLVQIYDALEADMYAGLNMERNTWDGNLTKWTEQGVLLMNMALTVREKVADKQDTGPASHQEIWKPFAQYVISALQEVKYGLVFIGWGAKAQDVIGKEVNIFAHQHHVLYNEHPVSASYKKQKWVCDHFTKTNAILIANGKGDPIKW